MPEAPITIFELPNYGSVLGTDRIPVDRLGAAVTAGAFVVNQAYQIVTVGTTSYTAIGAASNTVGVYFVATGAGSGTGTAAPINTGDAPLSAVAALLGGDPAGTAAAAVTAHEAAADPHPTYTTAAELAAAIPGSTDAVPEGSANRYFTGARAIAAALTGFTAGAGSVSATDSILQAIQKIVGNIAGCALTGLIGSSGLTMNTNRILLRSTAGTGAVEEGTTSGGLVLVNGVLVPGEIVKLVVSNVGETGITTGNFKSETRIDRAFVVVGVWWSCHPTAMGSAGTSDARPYIRTGAGTTSVGTKTNLLTTTNNIASLAASVHTVDATSSISGGTYSGSAGDWLGVDLMSLGTGSSGHQLTLILRYS